MPWHDGTTSGGDGGSASTGILTNGGYSGAGNGSIMAINNVQVNSNGSSSVIISWSTPTNTKSWLDYGLTINYSARVYSANQFSRNHTVILHNISADKLYHFQITVENNCNFNLIASLQITCQSSSLSTPDQTFGTAPDGVAGGSTEENVFFYHTDPMGTPVAMSDHTGTKVWEADYFPFGREYTVEADIANNRRFINKEKDAESGYSYFGARYLDTSLGRFLTADPVKLVDQSGKINQAILTNPQRLNMYVYGLNNPYRYVDPDGEESKATDALDIYKGFKNVKKHVNQYEAVRAGQQYNNAKPGSDEEARGKARVFRSVVKMIPIYGGGAAPNQKQAEMAVDIIDRHKNVNRVMAPYKEALDAIGLDTNLQRKDASRNPSIDRKRREYTNKEKKK